MNNLTIAPKAVHDITKHTLITPEGQSEFSHKLVACSLDYESAFKLVTISLNYDVAEENYTRNDFQDPVDGLVILAMQDFHKTWLTGNPWPATRQQWAQAVMPHMTMFFQKNPAYPKGFMQEAVARIMSLPYSQPGDLDLIFDGLVDYITGDRYLKLEGKLSKLDPAAKRELLESVPRSIRVPGNKGAVDVDGINSFPTIVPPETIVLGNDWGRRGDILTLISTAGAGKSVAMIQMGIAWGLGLPYMGIRPPRPLRILIFSGEDDGTTIGQCREGFLEHSEAITGVSLTGKDLDPLDRMIRTKFSREHVGDLFHSYLSQSLADFPADLVIINPMLSYLGGEVVASVSSWLRKGIMPVLQQHNCAALIAHHTTKMLKDGWDSVDDTYSAIGGAEVANIPRSILTLRPTPSEGMFVVTVSKRQTTGWEDSAGKYATKYFVRKSEEPTRPAWIPVPYDEAEELIAGVKGAAKAEKKEAAKKVTNEHILEVLKSSPDGQGSLIAQKALIEILCRKCECGGTSAKNAILDAEESGVIVALSKPNPRGGIEIKMLCLPGDETKGRHAS